MTRLDRRRQGHLTCRRATAIIAAAALALQMGCHVYLPVQESVPSLGQSVSVELNDRGRLMMSGRLGESVLRVEGMLVDSSETAVVLGVARTVQMQGSSVVWTGEQVTIPREGVRHFQRRQFSKSRSLMLTAGVVLVVGAVISGLSVLSVAGGRNPPDDNCAPDCPDR